MVRGEVRNQDDDLSREEVTMANWRGERTTIPLHRERSG
jgi:hypothetical protein